MADLSGDGIEDMISGSYWPGDLILFRGRADGTFEKGEVMKDSEGKNINVGGTWKSDRDPDMDSLATAPHAWDVDGDGDLDLIVGNFAGHVILIPNEGTKEKPSFVAKNRRPLEAGGSTLKVRGDSGPWVADWDQDGVSDLLVGDADGAVTFFRNTGTKTETKLARGVELLAKSKLPNILPAGQVPSGPGLRTKLCVTDWNLDGRPDLLVGDFWTGEAPQPALTADEKKRKEELTQKQSDLYVRHAKLAEKREANAAEMQKIQEEIQKNRAELEKLSPPHEYHGSVWLYLREKADR